MYTQKNNRKSQMSTRGRGGLRGLSLLKGHFFAIIYKSPNNKHQKSKKNDTTNRNKQQHKQEKENKQQNKTTNKQTTLTSQHKLSF